MTYAPFQRDEPADRERLEPLLSGLLAELQRATDVPTRITLLGRTGETLRVRGDYEAALPYLREAIDLSQQQSDHRGEVINLIRLATNRQYQGAHEAAEALFRWALSLIHKYHLNCYEDFAWQHLGKCLVEMGHIDEAHKCFTRALRLRRAKRDPALLASTERALAAAKHLRSGGTA